MTVLNIRENPAYLERGIAYIQSKWGNRRNKKVYEDCITHSIGAKSPLPVWYLLLDDDTIIGCVGLITNDFISRVDLWPWLCALYIDKAYRGRGFGNLLLSQAKIDVAQMGFAALYLCTDHKGYYEKYGFSYIGDGYHPWGESSRIYECSVS
ncbi:MAG: GNAT family N-acetyltransferase [Oscillospiraceae bacterium]|nr:GNAT family N-acetyltransferase [Oscillospiraceae bacterium]